MKKARAVEMLRSAGHDFVVVQVHSGEEQRPSAFGEPILEEAETGSPDDGMLARERLLVRKGFLDFSTELQRWL